MTISSASIVTNLVASWALRSAFRITTAVVTVPILLTDSRIIVTIAANGIWAGLYISMAIRSVAVVANLLTWRTLKPALRITTAVVTVPILLTDSRIIVTIAANGIWTGLYIRMAIRSVAIVADLLTWRALKRVVVIAEATLGVANFVYGTRRVILAKDPAFPLRKARLRGVVAGLIDVARFDHGVRPIGEAQINLRIAPEVASAFIVSITRA